MVADGTVDLHAHDSHAAALPQQLFHLFAKISAFYDEGFIVHLNIDVYKRQRVTRLEFQNMNVDGDMKTLAISHATCSTSADLGVKGIVAFTESGSTARAVSTYRPGAPIIAATPSEKTFNRLTMSWGCLLYTSISS